MSNLENSAVAIGLEKVNFHSNPKKCSAKECSNYSTLAFISHSSKEVSKSFKLGFNSMRTDSRCSSWILKRQRNLRCTYVRVGAKRRLYTEEFMLFTVMLEKTLESPLDCEEIKPVNPEGNQP